MDDFLNRVLGVAVRVQAVPDLPDVRLHLVAADADLEAPLRSLWDLPSAPYWAFCWGAGQALARHVIAHPECVRGLRVVDFGAGSGVVAIAAARAGATRVTAVDTDPTALEACQANAEVNGVAIETAVEPPTEWDVMLSADVLYEPYNLPRIADWCTGGRRLLVGVPERPGTPTVPWEPIARVAARTFPDVDPPVDHARLYEIG